MIGTAGFTSTSGRRLPGVSGQSPDRVNAARSYRRSTRYFEGSVKPSAQPTLVRTQHPPPPPRTASDQHNHGPGAVCFFLAQAARRPQAALGRCSRDIRGMTRGLSPGSETSSPPRPRSTSSTHETHTGRPVRSAHIDDRHVSTNHASVSTATTAGRGNAQWPAAYHGGRAVAIAAVTVCAKCRVLLSPWQWPHQFR
jgi:hypothetical protein